MNLNQAIQILAQHEPVLGAFQSFTVFENGAARVIYRHGTRPFDNNAALIAWCETLSAPLNPNPNPNLNPS